MGHGKIASQPPRFLNYLMMGTPASPLYKALVDSGLGSRVIGGGLDDGMLQATFSVGLKDEQPKTGRSNIAGCDDSWFLRGFKHNFSFPSGLDLFGMLKFHTYFSDTAANRFNSWLMSSRT